LSREDVKTYIGRVFDVDERRADALMTVVDNAQIQTRRAIFPIDYTIERRSLTQTSREYREHAIAIVTGQPRDGLHIVDAETYTFPGSLDAMGFDLRDTGFHIVLSKDVPDLIRGRIRELVDTFLHRRAVARDQIRAFLLHPGGQKLLTYIEEQLGLCRCETQLSWDILASYGNLSSATVLFILDAFLQRPGVKPGDYGLAAAFGPGFSAELVLLQWQ